MLEVVVQVLVILLEHSELVVLEVVVMVYLITMDHLEIQELLIQAVVEAVVEMIQVVDPADRESLL
jgi:hypothetical protein